jgi:hypothetical protein
MKTYLKHLRIALLFATLSVFVSGCAGNLAKGPVYSAPAAAPSDKALIYCYRPPGGDGPFSSHDRSYFLMVNSNKVNSFYYGGYFQLLVDPGKLELVTDLNHIAGMYIPLIPAVIEAAKRHGTQLEITVEGGKVYYLRLQPQGHFTYLIPTLVLKPQAEAENDIRRCKLTISKPAK